MNFLKSMLFYPMMFLRGILQLGLRFLGGILFLGSIMMFIMLPEGEKYKGFAALGGAFVFFMIGWFYDIILLKLNPHPDTVLILK